MASNVDRIVELEKELLLARTNSKNASLAAENTCARLILYQAVVDAARKFVEDPTHVNALFALDNAVAELDNALKKEPRA